MAGKPKTTISIAAFTHDEAKRAHISTTQYQPLTDEQSSAPIRVAYERRNRDLDPQLVFMSPAERQQRSHANKALQRNLHRAKDPSGIIAVETVPVVTKLVDLRRALALSRLVLQR